MCKESQESILPKYSKAKVRSEYVKILEEILATHNSPMVSVLHYQTPDSIYIIADRTYI